MSGTEHDLALSHYPGRTTPTIGLALGGGGARGIAHIVVLEVLDELGVRPAAIAGTSMGAVIGAAYAAGMTGREIRSYAVRVLRNRRLVLGRMLEARVGRFTDLLTRGLTNPVLVDAELVLPFFWPDRIPPQFEALEVPLLVVAADYQSREAAVLSSGDLRTAVAASIAIPGLIKPVIRDGRILIDGGAVLPLPHELLTTVADRILACDVSMVRTEASDDAPAPLRALLGASQIMQAALTARIVATHPPDLLIRPSVERFRLLDFFYAGRILEAADAERDAIKRRIAALLNRADEA